MQFSRRRIGAFARSVGSDAAEYYDPVIAGFDGFRDVIAPAVFAVVPGQHQLNELLAELAPGSLPLLHGVHITMSQPIVAGAHLNVAVEAGRPRNSGDISALTVETEISDDSGQSISKITQKLALLSPVVSRRGGASPQPTVSSSVILRPGAKATQSAESRAKHMRADAAILDATLPPGRSMTVGGSFEIQLTQKDLRDYVTVSDDANLIHTDAHYAQSVGYQAPLAQGMLLLGRAISQLEADLGRYLIPQQIRARFISPVPVPAVGAIIIGHATHKNNAYELTFTHQNHRVARATITTV